MVFGINEMQDDSVSSGLPYSLVITPQAVYDFVEFYRERGLKTRVGLWNFVKNFREFRVRRQYKIVISRNIYA